MFDENQDLDLKFNNFGIYFISKSIDQENLNEENLKKYRVLLANIQLVSFYVFNFFLL